MSDWRKAKRAARHKRADRPTGGVGAANEGRRLMPAELAKAAAAMGLSVSGDRYRPDDTAQRRALAFREAKAKELPPDAVAIKRFARSLTKTKHGPRKPQI